MPSLRSLGADAFLIVFGSIVAFSAYGLLLRITRPAIATSYAYVNPVVALVLGIALGGEHAGRDDLDRGGGHPRGRGDPLDPARAAARQRRRRERRESEAAGEGSPRRCRWGCGRRSSKTACSCGETARIFSRRRPRGARGREQFAGVIGGELDHVAEDDLAVARVRVAEPCAAGDPGRDALGAAAVDVEI